MNFQEPKLDKNLIFDDCLTVDDQFCLNIDNEIPINGIVESMYFDMERKIVSLIYSRDNSLHPIFQAKPIVDSPLIPSVKILSLFKLTRKARTNCISLIHAFKKENNWSFKDTRDENIILRKINKCAEKFINENPDNVTLILQHSNPFNEHIAKVISSQVKDVITIRGAIRKITTIEVCDMVMSIDSEFRRHYKANLEEAFDLFERYLDEMDQSNKGIFSRQLLKDLAMRKVVDRTLKLSMDSASRDAHTLTDRNVLIFDDITSNEDSISRAVDLIIDCYAPKSVTGFMLFSPSNKDREINPALNL